MSQNRNSKTTLLLKAAKSLIDDGEREAARALLQTIADDPKAQAWLQKLGSPARSSLLPIAGAALIVVMIVFVGIGFGIGRASAPVIPASAAASEIDSLLSAEDYVSATAVVEQAQERLSSVEQTNVFIGTASYQTEAAVIGTATQSAISTQNALATWGADQTATQAAKGN